MNAQLPRAVPALNHTSTGLSPYFNRAAGTCVMVDEKQRQILDAMYAMAGRPSSEGYHALSMTKAVERLRAGGDLPNAQYQPHRPNRRCLVHSGFEIEYEVVPGVFGQGAIEVVEIRLLKKEAIYAKRAGLWKVKALASRIDSKDKWQADGWLPDLASVAKRSSLKIGVNGYFKSLSDAANYMPSHIARGSLKKTEELEKAGYHLFYSPNKGVLKSGWQSAMNSVSVFSSKTHAKDAFILASYMQQAHEKEISIEWTAHRGGSYVLTEAMKLLSNKAMDLQKRQSVYLSDNTTSHAVTDAYRRKLNMDISESKWVNSGYGIGHMLGGGLLGCSDLTTALTVLSKDTPADKKVGKFYQLSKDMVSVAAKNHGLAVGAIVAWSGFGVTAASAAVVAKLLSIAANSTPALTNDYCTRSDQATADFLDRSVGMLIGKSK